MPGVNQLPDGAEGAAALSLIYATISFACSGLLLWLTIVHQERWSYIFLMAASTGISTIASTIQQIHDVTFYEDIMREQFIRKTDFYNNPELAIANGSYGMDLVLYYIQYYQYNVQAMFVMFWAGELAQSVYGLNSKPGMRIILRRVNLAGKAMAIVLPLITILLLRVPAIQKVFVVFILIADLPLMISLAIGSGLVLAILFRYSHTKKRFTHWTPPNQKSSNLSEGTEGSTIRSAGGSRQPTPRRQGFHDRWLMVRFCVSFLVLAIFEVTNTLFQLQSVSNIRKDIELKEPDLSADRARTTLFLFMPGTSPGIFLFIVFGTTAGCRSKIRKTFSPKNWPMWKWVKGRVESRPPPRGHPASLILSDDAKSDFSAFTRSTYAKSSDIMKPLPAPPSTPVSRYNRHIALSSDSINRAPGLDRGHSQNNGSIQLRNMPSLSQVQEEYYSPTPEHSDDSGPILPIMKEENKTRISRGQLGLTGSGPTGQHTRTLKA